jgi:hypothetical protein
MNQYEITEIDWYLLPTDPKLPTSIMIKAKSRNAAFAQILLQYGRPIKFAVIELL